MVSVVAFPAQRPSVGQRSVMMPVPFVAEVLPAVENPACCALAFYSRALRTGAAFSSGVCAAACGILC